MKISDHIKHSLDACDRRDLNQAMLFACLAIDGTAKKTYPGIAQVGARFRKLITDNIEIIELMFGGIDLENTKFPVKSTKGVVGLKFADIIYEKYRCSLAHGDELPPGYQLELRIAEGIQSFSVDIAGESMTFPESAVFALGLACVLAPANAGQKIGDNRYHYTDGVNAFVVDRWRGKIDCAKQIMDLPGRLRITMNF